MFGELKASYAIDLLISVLSDSVTRVRNVAVSSLEDICSETAVESFLTLLEENKETGSRSFIYRALVEIGS